MEIHPLVSDDKRRCKHVKEQLNFFVAVKEFYEDPDFLGGGDEFFGGQNINDFFYNKIATRLQL